MKSSRTSPQITIALVGQANVGKSVIFNFLTGMHQHIGNWPGKTVEKAKGTLFFDGYTIDVIDLPGIYSLATFSIEELITRQFILEQKPDFIIQVVDATHLERNLLLTLQLLELEVPMVLALNQADLLPKHGITLDYLKLSSILNIPVVPTEAIYGKGIDDVLKKGLTLITAPQRATLLNYGQEVEQEISTLTAALTPLNLPYPNRWLAIKLLEKDKEVKEIINHEAIRQETQNAISRLEKIHGHGCEIIIAAERCQAVYHVTTKVTTISSGQKPTLSDKIDNVICNKFFGYPILIGITAFLLCFVFIVGNMTSTFLESFFPLIHSCYYHWLGNHFLTHLGWAGIESLLGILTLVIPYIAPFYFMLYLLENSGYLSRAAFLTDNLMHKLGIHGKAFVPLLLGYGCNVNGCLACRIMETYRERLITAVLATSVPCSAVTIIILGLVGKYMGLWWVLGLYFGNFLFVLALGKLLNKTLPGKSVELIMVMPNYHFPHLKTALIQTWFKAKEFFVLAGPIIIIVGIIIQALYLSGILNVMISFLKPITVNWLGLPETVGILLIFGILRKELILILLATLLGNTDFSNVLSLPQMLTLTVVSMLYIPCISTMVAFQKEFGWKKMLVLSAGKIAFALLIGGIIAKIMIL